MLSHSWQTEGHTDGRTEFLWQNRASVLLGWRAIKTQLAVFLKIVSNVVFLFADLHKILRITTFINLNFKKERDKFRILDLRLQDCYLRGCQSLCRCPEERASFRTIPLQQPRWDQWRHSIGHASSDVTSRQPGDQWAFSYRLWPAIDQ